MQRHKVSLPLLQEESNKFSSGENKIEHTGLQICANLLGRGWDVEAFNRIVSLAGDETIRFVDRCLALVAAFDAAVSQCDLCTAHSMSHPSTAAAPS